MMDKNTFDKLINMLGYVVEEILEFTDTELHLLMRPKKRLTAICSYCGQKHSKGYHSSDTVIAEEHPISGRRVFLHIKKRKHRCPEDGKIHVEKTPWLKLFSQITSRYAKQVSNLAAITTNTEAGWYLGLDDEVVYRIDNAYLQERVKEKLEPIPSAIHLSVDEVSYKKYHNYLTNVIDTDRKLIIWNQKSRNTRSILYGYREKELRED